MLPGASRWKRQLCSQEACPAVESSSPALTSRSANRMTHFRLVGFTRCAGERTCGMWPHGWGELEGMMTQVDGATTSRPMRVAANGAPRRARRREP